MKVKVQKEDGGTYSVSTKRTRREEERVGEEQGVPREQLEQAVTAVIKKTRRELL